MEAFFACFPCVSHSIKFCLAIQAARCDRPGRILPGRGRSAGESVRERKGRQERAADEPAETAGGRSVQDRLVRGDVASFRHRPRRATSPAAAEHGHRRRRPATGQEARPADGQVPVAGEPRLVAQAEGRPTRVHLSGGERATPGVEAEPVQSHEAPGEHRRHGGVPGLGPSAHRDAAAVEGLAGQVERLPGLAGQDGQREAVRHEAGASADEEVGPSAGFPVHASQDGAEQDSDVDEGDAGGDDPAAGVARNLAVHPAPPTAGEREEPRPAGRRGEGEGVEPRAGADPAPQPVATLAQPGHGELLPAAASAAQTLRRPQRDARPAARFRRAQQQQQQ